MSAALVHLVLMVVFIVLKLTNSDDYKVPKHLLLPITKNLGVWLNKSEAVNYPVPIGDKLKSECSLATPYDSRSPDFYIQPLSLYITTYDTRWAIILFHFLSFAFQFCNSIFADRYNATFSSGETHLSHFLEYSISASIMITTMSVQLGVQDIYTLMGVFCNSWACMMLGFFAEILFQNNVPKVDILIFKWSPHWIAHISGWVTLCFAVAAVLSSLNTFLTCMNGVELPSFVYPLVVAEMVIFCSFGGVQFWEFCCKPPSDRFTEKEGGPEYKKRVQWAFRVEFWYIVLSLAAKTILGCVVYFCS
jgi:hypothetical protein